MRDLRTLNGCRLVEMELKLYGTIGDETCGAFELPCPKTGAALKVIASSGHGWDHVSVSLANRIPNWTEMDAVKRAFFKDDETAWQYHVATEKHINLMPNCLHLWRKQGFDMPLPPSEFV